MPLGQKVQWLKRTFTVRWKNFPRGFRGTEQVLYPANTCSRCCQARHSLRLAQGALAMKRNLHMFCIAVILLSEKTLELAWVRRGKEECFKGFVLGRGFRRSSAGRWWGMQSTGRRSMDKYRASV